MLTSGKKYADQARCLYVGARVLCTVDNEDLTEEVPLGHRTLCQVVEIKMKDPRAVCCWKIYYGRGRHPRNRLLCCQMQ